MATYFVFSDESGAYKQNRGPNYLRKRPYYVRSALMIDVDNWIKLKERFIEVKKSKNLPLDKEIKWSYLWSLKKHRNNNETIPADRPYYFLRDFKEEDLISYVKDVCLMLKDCNMNKIIITITLNEFTAAISKANIYKMHLQELMQRIEMEIQDRDDNLAILFFDPENQEVDSLIRSAYREIYLTGDFISKYAHIKDSISFELSHHSFGVQIADYIAGIFNGFLRNYSISKTLFQECVSDVIRRSPSGEIFGYGVREVPRSDENREKIKDKFDTVLVQKEAIVEDIEVPF